jgi:SAM-dependent methyltransferase
MMIRLFFINGEFMALPRHGIVKGMNNEQEKFYSSSEEYFHTLSNQDGSYFLPFIDYVSLYAKAGGRLLDLGCGVGQSTELLKKAGHEVVGSDGCERFVRQAKKIFPENEYFFCQAESLVFPDDSFNCVASYNTIEHLIDLPKVIAEVSRVLKPGGIFIIHSPNLLSIQHPINAIKKFKGMTYEGKKNSFRLMSMAIRNTAFLFIRRLSGKAMIVYREPQKIFDFPDVDATWLMNPLDMKNLLKENGFVIDKYQNIDSLRASSFLKKLASKLIPEQMGIIRIVAKKKIPYI